MDYVSLIKINGRPILPPLITDTKRVEIENYRNRAIILEKQLKIKRSNNVKKNKLKRTDAETFTYKERNTIFEENSRKPLDVPCDSFIEPKAALIDNNDANDISFSKSELLNPSAVEINLDKSYSDLPEYELSQSAESISSNTSNQDLSETKNSQFSTLVRRYSYTLDNPSPILLAYMEKQKSNTNEAINNVPKIIIQSDCEQTLSSEDEVNCKSMILQPECSIKNANDDSNKIIVSENLVLPNDGYKKSFHENIEDFQKSREDEFKIKRNTYEVSQDSNTVVEVITTDIKLEEIKVTTPLHDNKSNSDFQRLMSSTPVSSSEALTKSEIELKELLLGIPSEYSEKIMELVQKTKIEVQNQVDSFESFKNNFGSDVIQDNVVKKLTYPNTRGILVQQNEIDNDDTTCSECFEDFDNKIQDEKLNDQFKPMLNEFPKNKLLNKSELQTKKEWAASIIGAHVKGYLVRRLMKSFKVQMLIQTIKDTLLCAIELHKSDVIEEADVELHRRLIQQVSAACYAFHDVFFSLSIPEQMEIIAIDREKLRKRMLKTNLSSSALYPKSKSYSPTTRLSKSLTKV